MEVPRAPGEQPCAQHPPPRRAARASSSATVPRGRSVPGTAMAVSGRSPSCHTAPIARFGDGASDSSELELSGSGEAT
eukprot:9991070-Lingulodinium_polyedra.AAC.1